MIQNMDIFIASFPIDDTLSSLVPNKRDVVSFHLVKLLLKRAQRTCSMKKIKIASAQSIHKMYYFRDELAV